MIDGPRRHLCRTVFVAVLYEVLGTSSVVLPQAVPPPVVVPKSASARWGGAVAVLAFAGVTVVDVTDGRLVPGQTVVVVGSRVQAVGPTGNVRVPQGAQVVDVRGKYVIPGLWDMHIHPLNYPDVYYPLLVANGVTGIRDAGTSVPLAKVLQWRQEIAAGALVGPRVIASGPSFGTLYKGHLDTPAKVRRVVDSLKAAGVDMIKIRNVSKDDYFRIAAAARQAGLPFGGHLPGGRSKTLPVPVPVTQVADSGVTIVDHDDGLQGTCMGDSAGNAARLEVCRPVAQYLRRHNTWMAPTFHLLRRIVFFAEHKGVGLDSAAVSLSYSEGKVRLVRPSAPAPVRAPDAPAPVPVWARMSVMDSADVPILAATDAAAAPSLLFRGLVPGYSLHDEMASLVWAGLTPLTVLRAATLNPAKALNATDSLGTVAPGKLADLVLLDANPLIDIRNTTKIWAVVANGRYFDRAALDRLLAEAERGAPPR